MSQASDNSGEKDRQNMTVQLQNMNQNFRNSEILDSNRSGKNRTGSSFMNGLQKMQTFGEKFGQKIGLEKKRRRNLEFEEASPEGP